MDTAGIGQAQSIQAALNAQPPLPLGQAQPPAVILNPAVLEMARLRELEKLRERQRGRSPSSFKVQLDRAWTPDVEETPQHAGKDGQRPEERPPHLDILV